MLFLSDLANFVLKILWIVYPLLLVYRGESPSDDQGEGDSIMRKQGSFILVLIAGCVCLLGACSSGENASDSTTKPQSNPTTTVIREAAGETGVAADCGARGQGVDLHGCDLTGADLTGADLTNANLTYATLTNANLTNANLTIGFANMKGVRSGGITGTPVALPSGYRIAMGYLVGLYADLTDAKLAGANLNNANLSDANLTRADLTGAKMESVNWPRANLEQANLTGATPHCTKGTGITGTPAALPSGYRLSGRGWLNGHIYVDGKWDGPDDDCPWDGGGARDK